MRRLIAIASVLTSPMWGSAARDRRARAVHRARALPVLARRGGGPGRAQAELGIISEAADHDIDRKAHVKYLDRGDRGLAYGTGMTVTPQICAASTVGFREVWFGADDRAQALRARVMPLFTEGPLRIPDFIGAEADAPSDEAARSDSSPKIRVTN